MKKQPKKRRQLSSRVRTLAEYIGEHEHKLETIIEGKLIAQHKYVKVEWCVVCGALFTQMRFKEKEMFPAIHELEKKERFHQLCDILRRKGYLYVDGKMFERYVSLNFMKPKIDGRKQAVVTVLSYYDSEIFDLKWWDVGDKLRERKKVRWGELSLLVSRLVG